MKVTFYVTWYNKPEFLSLQYSLIKKYCEDEWKYIIINNGANKELVDSFSNFCKDNNIEEIQTFQERGKEKQDHSRAIKFAINNYIKNDDSDFRVIMDSDIFPFKKFSIVNTMENNYVGGMRLENGLPYISSFIMIFSKYFSLENIPIAPNTQDDAGYWTVGMYRNYPFKWLKHSSVERKEMNYIFQNHPDIISLFEDDLVFQIIEDGLIHYWQGTEWSNHNIEFHKRKLKLIESIVNYPSELNVVLDDNVFYDSVFMDKWIRKDNYPLNKLS